MNTQDLSFFTICYEADWRSLLLRGKLAELVASCNYSFTFKGLIINNVKDRDAVTQAAEGAVKDGLLDAFYFAEDTIDQVLNFFNIKRKSFVLDSYDGFWYSIAPLTSIYFSQTSFTIFFTGDCIMTKQSDPKWISLATEIMLANDQYVVANPLWDFDRGEYAEQSIKQDEHWYVGHGFSDQCFLVKTATFQSQIYNHYHVYSEAYPIYGGNLFERRVNSYMQAFGKLRLTSKIASYHHGKLIDTEYQRPASFKKPILATTFYSWKKRIRRFTNLQLLKLGLHI